MTGAVGEQPDDGWEFAPHDVIGLVQRLSLARGLDEIMMVVRRGARHLTGADGVTFVLRDHGFCHYADEDAISPLWKGQRFPLETCISGWAMLNRQPVAIPDIYLDSRIPHQAYRPTFVKSLVMVPVRREDPVGAIGAYWATRREPSQAEIDLLMTIANAAALAMTNVALYTSLVAARDEAAKRSRDLEGLFLASPAAIVGLDRDGRVRWWNRAAERIFGYPARRVIGRPPPIVPRADRQRTRELFQRTIDGETLRDFRGVWRARSGRPVEVEFSTSPLTDAAGETTGMVCVVSDVSLRNQLERQLLQAQKMEAVGQFTGGIAHDFNNLLGVLIGNLDLVHERVTGDPEALGLIDAAVEAALRGADLNRRLLAFSRRQPLNPEIVDVNATLADMVKLLQRALGERVEIKFHRGPDLWPVLVDPVQMETAIVNLAVNARDAMPDGGVLTLESRTAQIDADYAVLHEELRAGDYVMVAVSDTGGGMTPEVLRRAFDPFFTTKAVGKGTGLGLSMVYGLMKQSGGHVNIYSEIGQGTTIRLYLPRAAPAGTTPKPEEKTEVGERGRAELVLVVEDNPDMQRVVVRQLTDLGYRVETADTAGQAITRLDQGLRPDLLFSDMVMPGTMDGLELAGHVAARLPDTRILLTSGFTEHGAVEAHQRKGLVMPFPLLGKPYRKDTLARAVRAVLDGRAIDRRDSSP